MVPLFSIWMVVLLVVRLVMLVKSSPSLYRIYLRVEDQYWLIDWLILIGFDWFWLAIQFHDSWMNELNEWNELWVLWKLLPAVNFNQNTSMRLYQRIYPFQDNKNCWNSMRRWNSRRRWNSMGFCHNLRRQFKKLMFVGYKFHRQCKQTIFLESPFFFF